MKKRTFFIIDLQEGNVLAASSHAMGWLTPFYISHLKNFISSNKNESRTCLYIIINGRSLSIAPLLTYKDSLWIVTSEDHKPLDLEEGSLLNNSQLHIAQNLALGFTEKETAFALNMRLSTVRYHRKRIYQILSIENRSDLAKIFMWL